MKTNCEKEFNFETEFKKVLIKEAEDFRINWDSVDIKSIHYQSTLMTELPMTLDKYTVRMRVVEDEIPDIDIDNWFRSHKFIYGMMSKSVRTDSEQTDMLTFDVGTIESIATQIRNTFRNFHAQ